MNESGPFVIVVQALRLDQALTSDPFGLVHTNVDPPRDVLPRVVRGVGAVELNADTHGHGAARDHKACRSLLS